MKTIKFLAIMTVAAMLASCGSSRNTSTATSTNSQPSSSLGVDVDLPCVYESMDDDNYFRELGTSTHMNMQSARDAAFDAAKAMCRRKLAEFVQGLSTSYSRTVAGQAPVDKTQRLMESEMNGIVEEMLNNVQKVCEKMKRDDAGNYLSFIAIQIPKGQMVNKMASTLSANEELEGLFNRDQFRKYAEEKMAQMKAAQQASSR